MHIHRSKSTYTGAYSVYTSQSIELYILKHIQQLLMYNIKNSKLDMTFFFFFSGYLIGKVYLGIETFFFLDLNS